MTLELKIKFFQESNITGKSDEHIKSVFEEVMNEIQLQQLPYDDDDDDNIDIDNPQLLQRSVTSIENTYSQLVATIIYSGVSTERKSIITLLIPQDKQVIVSNFLSST
jgi:hypothetical protein